MSENKVKEQQNVLENLSEHLQRAIDIEYLLEAVQVAHRDSQDDHTQVGCIIVNSKTKTVVAQGANKFSPLFIKNRFNTKFCNIELEQYLNHIPTVLANPNNNYIKQKYPYIIHAEVNCVLDLLRNEEVRTRSLGLTRNLTMYITLAPCDKCAQMIVSAGIGRVVYLDDKYDDKDYCIAGRILLEACGVQVDHISLKDYQ